MIVLHVIYIKICYLHYHSKMSFSLDEIQKAYSYYKQYKLQNPPLHHERFIFPLFSGTYFCYRKIDILRIVSIAKSLSQDPSFVDVGCGNGDFLTKIKKYLPKAIGIEQNATLYYILNRPKPDYVHSYPIEVLNYRENSFDIVFVGWMQPGTDFRRHIARLTKCIITTFDAGGQCGVNGGCEYEEFGFKKLASWRSPSWIDVNGELMNKFYEEPLKLSKNNHLSNLRTAHNLWYVYSTPEQSDKITRALKDYYKEECRLYLSERFDFEDLLDSCGFSYHEKLLLQPSYEKHLWKIEFH